MLQVAKVIGIFWFGLILFYGGIVLVGNLVKQIASSCLRICGHDVFHPLTKERCNMMWLWYRFWNERAVGRLYIQQDFEMMFGAETMRRGRDRRSHPSKERP